MAVIKLSKKLIPLMLASSFGLAGCASFVHYPHPDFISKKTAAGAVGGAATGAIVSSAATGVASAGLGVGVLAGAAVGTFFNSPSYWLHKLQSDGVTVIQTGQKVKVVIPSDKIFIVATDSILPQSYSTLSDVTQFIQNYGRVYITVNSYTDNVGSPATDLKLSLGQAKSVMAFFWSHGIPSSNLKAVGHGQANPIGANYTSVGSAYNRRIEVTFAYG